MVGLEGAALPFVGPSEARTTANHSVAGNPDRLRHGQITLRSDDRWRTAMASRDRRLVSALTAPLLLRYRLSASSSEAGRETDETIFDRAPAGEGAASRAARRVRRHFAGAGPRGSRAWWRRTS